MVQSKKIGDKMNKKIIELKDFEQNHINLCIAYQAF